VNVFVSQTGGTQFQDEGVNRGGPAPSFVNFTGAGVTATYTPSSDTVVVNIPGSSSSSSGGGGGKPVVYAKKASSTQSSGSILIYDTVSAYEPTLGQYDTTNGIFTANASGFFSFSASVTIYRTYTPSNYETWYLGLGKYVSGKEIFYSFSQFTDLYTSNSSQGLRSSISASIPMTAGQQAFIALIDRSLTQSVFKKNLSSSMMFVNGTESPGYQTWFMPTFSVIYYPLPPGEW
jgi:hypothetical protein